MTYAELKEMLGDKSREDFPLTAENENGEMVIIQQGEDDNGHFYRLEVLQHNNWMRVNTYYPDGIVTESYETDERK